MPLGINAGQVVDKDMSLQGKKYLDATRPICIIFSLAFGNGAKGAYIKEESTSISLHKKQVKRKKKQHHKPPRT